MLQRLKSTFGSENGSGNPFKIGLLLYLVAQVFFLIHIQFPQKQNFDEFHYVPAAKQVLTLEETRNWEHPPLGKILMAAGIAAFGDRPIGWRVMSTVFGALTLAGMYFWGLALFKSQRAALLVAGLTAVNQLLYVQSRIGMLDTFMMAFLVWAMAAFSAAWDPARTRRETGRLLAFAGVMLGLATACKWFALMPWLFCIGLVVMLRILQGWGTTFQAPASAESSDADWYHPKLFQGVRGKTWFLCLGVIPLLAYFATFLPFLWVQRAPGNPPYGLWDLVKMQHTMWDGQLRVVTQHPYMSTWTSWALMKRPIWYAFDREPSNDAVVRGVILLGNPLIMWGGLLALLGCLWGFVRFRSRAAFLILAFYGVLYFSWALIPRKIAFYYYYYPAALVLSLALAYVFELSPFQDLKRASRWAGWVFLVAATALFIYFFPILAALKIPSDSFQKWMWFSTWI